MTQPQAASELKLSERQVRRLITRLSKEGDKAIVHALRGRSNRKIEEEIRQGAIKIFSQEVYKGFGPTLASEYLANKHDIKVSKETTRQWMIKEGRWKGGSSRWQRCTYGESEENVWESWCNGIPTRTTG